MKDQGHSHSELSPATRSAFELAKKIQDKERLNTETTRDGLFPTMDWGIYARITTFNPPQRDGGSIIEADMSHRIQLGRAAEGGIPQTGSVADRTRMFDPLFEISIDHEGVVRAHERVMEVIALDDIDEEEADRQITGTEEESALHKDAIFDEMMSHYDERDGKRKMRTDVMSDEGARSAISNISLLLGKRSLDAGDVIDIPKDEEDKADPVSADTLGELKALIEGSATQETRKVSDIIGDEGQWSYYLETMTDANGEPRYIRFQRTSDNEWNEENGTRFNDCEEWFFYPGNKPVEYASFELGEYTRGRASLKTTQMVQEHNRQANRNREEKRENGELMATSDDINKGLEVLEQLAA